MRWLTRLTVLGVGAAIALAGCSSGSGDKTPAFSCSLAQQKQSIATLMQAWYLFNDEAEQQQTYASVDPSQFASAQAFLDALLYRPDRFDRHFSFLTTAQEDQQFFGAGQFVGFGFSSKFVDAPLDADLRLTQVISGSPAAARGFARGQRVLTIDGRTIADIAQAEGITAALGSSEIGVTRIFRLQRPDGSEFEVSVAKALVTLDPVPTATTFVVGTTTVGYLDFRTFISTADNALDEAFAMFAGADVTALVVDLRYNGGGLVSTAQRLGDLIGGFIAEGEIQAQTRFNSSKSALDTATPFQRRSSSLSLLQQVVFITTPSTASASELVINGLEPHTVVRLVGAPTFGKPVGQSALSYCGGQRLLRAVSFDVVNALGQGEYYDGLLVDCPASDDLERSIGDPLEASLANALTLVETGSCPAAPVSPKIAGSPGATGDIPYSVGDSSARRHAGVF